LNIFTIIQVGKSHREKHSARDRFTRPYKAVSSHTYREDNTEVSTADGKTIPSD